MLKVDSTYIIFKFMYIVIIVKGLILFSQAILLSFNLDGISLINVSLTDLLGLLFVLFKNRLRPLIPLNVQLEPIIPLGFEPFIVLMSLVLTHLLSI
jgi:hypothetical protein